jgi:hypothetical protein
MYLRIFIEFVSNNIIHRKNNFDVVLFCLLNESRYLFGSRSVEERIADLYSNHE